jgi:hypothetical protein
MGKIRLFVMAFAMSFASFSLSAQNFSIRFGGLMTLGDLAESKTVSSFVENARAGNAAAYGASVGFQFSVEVLDGLGLFASADAFWTPSNQEIRQMYDEHNWTKPQFFNIPLLVGLNYRMPVASVSPYFEAGIGMNLFVKTPEGVSGDLTKYEATKSLAVEGGLGLMFNDVVSVGVHYLLPGIDGVKISAKDVDVEDYDLKASMLMLRLGFHF